MLVVKATFCAKWMVHFNPGLLLKLITQANFGSFEVIKFWMWNIYHILLAERILPHNYCRILDIKMYLVCWLSVTLYIFSSSRNLKLAELFSKDGMSFLASCQNLVPRPWVIDDLDKFIAKWCKKSWKKASWLLFVFLWHALASISYCLTFSSLVYFKNMFYACRLSYLWIILVQMWFWVYCHLQESCFIGEHRFTSQWPFS